MLLTSLVFISLSLLIFFGFSSNGIIISFTSIKDQNNSAVNSQQSLTTVQTDLTNQSIDNLEIQNQ